MILLNIYIYNIIVECDYTLVDCDQKTALHWTASNPDPSCILILVDLYPSLLNKQ